MRSLDFWLSIAARLFIVSACVTCATRMLEAAAPQTAKLGEGSKPQMWTAVLVDARTKKPLPKIAVEVNGLKAGDTEMCPIDLTSDAAGRIQIRLPPKKATTVEVRTPGWW